MIYNDLLIGALVDEVKCVVDILGESCCKDILVCHPCTKLDCQTSLALPNILAKSLSWVVSCLAIKSITYSPGILYSGLHTKLYTWVWVWSTLQERNKSLINMAIALMIIIIIIITL